MEIILTVILTLVAVYAAISLKRAIEYRKKRLEAEEESWKFGWDKEKPKDN